MPRHLEDFPVSESVWLKKEDFEYLCFNLTRELMTYGEPIPDYSTRDSNLLESALASPRQTFNKKLLYPNFSKQGAILFYSLIKNHPFKNGNKRIAVMSLLIFLSLNDKWLEINPTRLYLEACKVSESGREQRDVVIKELGEFINKFVVEFRAEV